MSEKIKFYLEEQKHIRKYYCKECGKEFIPNSSNQLYCSTQCSNAVWKRYMAERQREDRMMETLSKIDKYAFQRLEALADKQQFIDDIPQINENKKCFACNSKKRLIEYHIRYQPEDKVILCHRCHMILHHCLLHRRKCRPDI